MANVKEIAPRIVVDADVHFGKAVIKGTRVPIEVILEQLALGGASPRLRTNMP